MARTSEEIRELRESAAKSAACCADCFRPLAPIDSVTMVTREVHIPAQTVPIVGFIKAQYQRLHVPICILCSLATEPSWWCVRGSPGKMECVLEGGPSRLRRLRCDGCGRPMRVLQPNWHSWRLTAADRACCADCLKAAQMRRDRERHRVHHQVAAPARAYPDPPQASARHRRTHALGLWPVRCIARWSATARPCAPSDWRGIGRALIEAAVEALRRGGARYLFVATLHPAIPYEPYERTRRFYEAMGFEYVLEEQFPIDPASPLGYYLKQL